MFKHILIPTDGSPLADKAVDRGLHFAAEIHAQVTLLTVTQPFHVASSWPLVGADEYAQYAEQHGRELLAPGIEIARTFGVPCEAIAIEHEQPYAAIIDVATSQDCDLVAMASHGRRGISAVVLGSETQKVLTHSRIPVLVLR
ncbi:MULTISPECIES: universal stress protein [Inquilinus]|uniref:Nucleotide-binding universal stress UspA family protein n=1 Tax=Inquilinus ginsengisoli TaxID=363840 RepID=A0ABU1JHX2_9PROT|nr:universal stress protein [Inquilinus ginsengisoli]MDR6288176.1 nucleotide-binding universal stress UspA family protein [Inquilinus ginsengisoli]